MKGETRPDPDRRARRDCRCGRGRDLGRWRGRGDSSGTNGGAPKAPADAVRLPFTYSPEKEKLLEPLIRDFNREDGGAFVEGQIIASGEAESKIADGSLEPVIWSPASSLWGRLLNFDADRPLAPDDNPSIVRTPLVIAMWEPFAKALGWPREPIGFEQVISLARSNQGFAEFGHPEFGRFKLVHANPDFSTSGLSAVGGARHGPREPRVGVRVLGGGQPAAPGRRRPLAA